MYCSNVLAPTGEAVFSFMFCFKDLLYSFYVNNSNKFKTKQEHYYQGSAISTSCIFHNATRFFQIFSSDNPIYIYA